MRHPYFLESFQLAPMAYGGLRWLTVANSYEQKEEMLVFYLTLRADLFQNRQH